LGLLLLPIGGSRSGTHGCACSPDVATRPAGGSEDITDNRAGYSPSRRAGYGRSCACALRLPGRLIRRRLVRFGLAGELERV
jgi:hypothetical protein